MNDDQIDALFALPEVDRFIKVKACRVKDLVAIGTSLCRHKVHGVVMYKGQVVGDSIPLERGHRYWFAGVESDSAAQPPDQFPW